MMNFIKFFFGVYGDFLICKVRRIGVINFKFVFDFFMVLVNKCLSNCDVIYLNFWLEVVNRVLVVNKVGICKDCCFFWVKYWM